MAFGAPCVTALVRRRHALMPLAASLHAKATLERVQCVVDGLGRLWLMPGTLASSSTPAFSPPANPRYLAAPAVRPHPESLPGYFGGAGLCPPGRWPRDAVRSSRMCQIGCKAGMSAGKFTLFHWLSPRIRGFQPPAGHPLAMPASGGCFATENSSWRARISSARHWPRPPMKARRRLVRLCQRKRYQRLLHGGIVIPAGDTVDVEAAVFRGKRPPG